MSKQKYQILESVSIKGVGEENEDLIGNFQNCFWLFDGATAVNKRQAPEGESGLAKWFCIAFDYFLKEELAGGPPVNYEDIILLFKRVLFRLKEKHTEYFKTLTTLEVPSMTLTFGCIAEEKVLLYTIGDSTVYILDNDNEVEKILDSRVEVFSSKSLEAFISHKGHPQKEKLVKQVISINREMMNREGGYWVASLDENWIQNGLYIERPINTLQGILLCSDGYERLFSTFNTYKVSEILQAEIGIEHSMQTLRELEADDPEGDLYPRLKKSDDASAILLSLKPNLRSS